VAQPLIDFIGWLPVDMYWFQQQFN